MDEELVETLEVLISGFLGEDGNNLRLKIRIRLFNGLLRLLKDQKNVLHLLLNVGVRVGV